MTAPLCFSDIRGGGVAGIHAMERAAVTRDRVLLIGPPGCGKAMIARRLPGILPPVTQREAFEITAARFAAGIVGNDGGWSIQLERARPFRSPHYSISAAGMKWEIALARHGVLYLDDLGEFSRLALEQLSRADDVLVVASALPCPCGRYGMPAMGPCECTPEARGRHALALLDRERLAWIHDRVILPPVSIADLSGPRGETSERIRARVVAAREALS